MKRYTVIDKRTDQIQHYSNIEWNLAWWVVFIIGIITGVEIGTSINILI